MQSARRARRDAAIQHRICKMPLLLSGVHWDGDHVDVSRVDQKREISSNTAALWKVRGVRRWSDVVVIPLSEVRPHSPHCVL
jgi:hypothetical protein